MVSLSSYSIRSKFSFVFSCFSSFFGEACGCRRLGAAFIYSRHGVAFICARTIQTSKVYLINDNKSNQWSSICRRTGIIGILVIIVISNM